MRLRFPLAVLLALMASVSMGLVALLLQAAANPQVAQGASASFPVTGSLGAANGQTWDVVNAAGTVVATAGTPAGWTVSLSGTTFTVGVPTSASVAANYTVRSGGGAVGPDAMRASASGATGVWAGGGAVRALKRTKTSAKVRSNAGGSPPASGGQSALFDIVAPPSPPTAPTSLTAIAASSNTINLAWSDNSSNETGFKIERKTGVGGTYAQVATTAANSTAYSDAGLAASTQYFYRVRVTGGGGDSAYSNEAGATTAAPSLPAAASGLTATGQSGTNVLLQWTDNSNNEDGFKVLRAPGSAWTPTGGGTAPTVVGTVGPNQTFFVDASAAPLTTYTYCVSAYNQVGQSYSNTAVVSTASGPPPGTAGTEFWIAVPSSGPTPPTMGSPYPGPSVLVTNGNPAGTPTANVTVAVPGLSFSQAVTVAPGAGATVALPAGAEATTADGVQTIATHVTSDQAIGVQIFQYKMFASEGFAALPVGTLGTQHVLVSYPSAGGDLNARFAVAASADGTTVTIVPSIAAGGHAAKTPYTVTLNRGDLYQLKTTGANQDLTGTLVSSDNPVYVVSGDQGAFVPVGVSSANPLTEAMPSVDRWGLQFVAVPYATRGGDLLRIVAARNGTRVSVAGTQVATLSAGGFIDQNLTAAETVSADKPILVEQMSEGTNSDGNAGADPFMTTVPALSQYVASAAWTTPPSTQMALNYVDVAVPTGAVGDLRLDGVIVPSASFAALGSTGYATAQLSVAAGSHVLSTPGTGQPFGAWAYGFPAGGDQPGYDGYGYATSLALPITPGFTWTPPVAPSGLSATAVSTGEIDLAWTNNATDQTGFRIERKTGSGGTWAPVTNVGASVGAYADTGLAKATTYVYRVIATNDLESQPSNEASATTFDTPPAAPTGLGASAVSSSEIDLSWSPGSGNEQGYYVERRTGSGAYAQVATVTGAATYKDQGLPKLMAFTYRIRAFNAYGTSSYSNEASATTLDTPPDAPSNLSAAAPAYNQVNLTWTDNAGNETGFKVERSGDGGSMWLQVALIQQANVQSYTDGSVQGATAYAYRVRATNGGDDSAYSNVATVTTPNPPSPTAPTGLTATAVSNTQIALSWTDTSNVEAGFSVEKLNGSIWGQVATVGANVTGWTDSGLTPQTAYSYRVRAYNASGYSAYSNVASATTFASGSGTVSQFAAAATGANKVTLYWTAMNGATGYNIYRSTTSGSGYVRVNPAPVNSVDPGPGVIAGRMYNDTTVSSGVQYYYTVTPIYGGSEGAMSVESSDIPSSRAIPWDAGDATAIVAKENAERPQDVPNWNQNGMTVAVGPNGVQYATNIGGGPALANAATANYNPDTGTLSTMEGDYPWVKDDNDGGNPQSSIDHNYPDEADTGPYRKVEAKPGYHIFESLIIFPNSYQGLNAANGMGGKSGPGDTACVYGGGTTVKASPGAKLSLDIGFQKGSDDKTGEKQGWQIVGFFGRKNQYGAYLNDEQDGPLVRGLRVDGAAYLVIVIPSPRGLPMDNIGVTIDAADYGGAVLGHNNSYVPPTINYTAYVSNFAINDYQRFMFKRVNSIAQKNVPSHMGYVRTGSYMRGGAWGNDYDPEDTGALLDLFDLLDPNHTAGSGAYPSRGTVVQWNNGIGHDYYEYYQESYINVSCVNP